MTAIPLTADIPVELTVSLTALGTHLHAGLSDTNSSETFIEDTAISALLYTTTELIPPAEGTTVSFRRRLTTHDLLEGVDTSDPNVQILLSNLLGCIDSSATEALLESFP